MIALVEVSEGECAISVHGKVILYFTEGERGTWNTSRTVLEKGYSGRVSNTAFSEARRQARWAFLSFENGEKAAAFEECSEVEILQRFLSGKRECTRQALAQWLASNGLWSTEMEKRLLELAPTPKEKEFSRSLQLDLV